jgi:two-component system, NtrC family, sensor histidine kinase HydH
VDSGTLWGMPQPDTPEDGLGTDVDDNATDIDELKSYVGFTDRDEVELAALQGAAAADIDELLSRFYGTIDAHEGARRVFKNPEKQRPRLRRSMTSWVLTLLEGPYDTGYAARRLAIGRAHVENQMPQRYMLTSMNVIRSWFMEVCVRTHSEDVGRLIASIHAVDRILDIELAMMLATYRDDLLARMQRQERLATLGELAAGIHHELKNPLAAIRTSAYALRERRSVRADARARGLLERIEGNVDRATEIITDLLSFARLRNPTREDVPVDTLVRGAVARVTIPPALQLTLDLDPELPAVTVDVAQMEHVLVNLLVNAFDACSGDGTVRITSRMVMGQVSVVLADDGEGIPERDLARVFEPLYSTKPEGVGLGLSLSQHLARANGAKLSIRSTHGEGTAVTLTFKG